MFTALVTHTVSIHVLIYIYMYVHVQVPVPVHVHVISGFQFCKGGNFKARGKGRKYI